MTDRFNTFFVRPGNIVVSHNMAYTQHMIILVHDYHGMVIDTIKNIASVKKLHDGKCFKSAFWLLIK